MLKMENSREEQKKVSIEFPNFGKIEITSELYRDMRQYRIWKGIDEIFNNRRLDSYYYGVLSQKVFN